MTLKDNSIIINGHQLREAMEFLAPDNTDEQLGQEVVISLGGTEFHSGPGLYCWAHEYPEEGAVKLDSEPSSPSSPTLATPAQREREAFEAWMRTFDMPPQLEGEVFLDEQLIDADCYGQFVYEDHSTQRCWAAWQARATFLTLPAAFAQPIRSAFLDGYRQGIHDESVDEEAAWNRSRSIHVAHDAEQCDGPPAAGVPEGPNYKFKFETLVDHCKRQDQTIADLRYDENIRRFYDEGAVWFWCGDETDNLETLACPVVINAGDLRALLSASPTPPASEQLQAVVLSAPVLERVEAFISGFEGDEAQEGVHELLAAIRAAQVGAA